MTLSTLAQKYLKLKNPKFADRVTQAWVDTYNPSTNENGYVNLATAENLLSLPFVSKRLAQAEPCKASDLSYDNMFGSLKTRQVVANFLENYITQHAVSADEIVLLTGAACAINCISRTICNPGEVVIITGPGYRGLEFEICVNSGIEIRLAHLDDVDEDSHPLVSVSALNDAYERAEQEGVTIKAVLICSPNNPTGEVLSAPVIEEIVSWCRERKLHAIFDEIYALSVHDPQQSFTSVAQVLDGNLGNDVHILWSVSKDFCLSGIRFGVLYSQNREIVQVCSHPLAFFSPTSRHSQKAISDMLSDSTWVESYIEDNKKRLRKGYEQCVAKLEQFGIPYMPAAAGFFIWVDLRKFMAEESVEEEMKLWERMCEVKVVTTPGNEFFGKRLGHFRLCFSAVSSDTLDVAWERLSSVFNG